MRTRARLRRARGLARQRTGESKTAVMGDAVLKSNSQNMAAAVLNDPRGHAAALVPEGGKKKGGLPYARSWPPPARDRERVERERREMERDRKKRVVCVCVCEKIFTKWLVGFGECGGGGEVQAGAAEGGAGGRGR